MGHKVLRLPPYHCIFNPIELIWHQLKAGIRRNNISPMLTYSVISLIENEVKKVSEINWKNFVQHVKKVEKSYCNVRSTEKKFIINLDNSSGSETKLVE